MDGTPTVPIFSPALRGAPTRNAFANTVASLTTNSATSIKGVEGGDDEDAAVADAKAKKRVTISPGASASTPDADYGDNPLAA